MRSRNALVDFSAVSLVDAEIISYLEPRAANIPELIAAKPDALDDHQDHAIDPVKWEDVGTVAEQAFLGINGLTITGAANPNYDQAGVIYKPAIDASPGKLVLSRFLMGHPMEFVVSLQEYAFTVDDVALPTTWTLKHLVAQDLRNSVGLRVAPGALYFFEGGAGGNEEFILKLPSRPSKTGEVYPIQVGFIFTAVGWDFYVHLLGIWDAPMLVKSYVRPGSVHAVAGYSFCVNTYTSDDDLHFYDLAHQFKSNAVVGDGRIVTGREDDKVIISSLDLASASWLGFNMGKTGTINVRIPDYSAALLTPDEVAQVTAKLTGKQVYAIEFEMNGDAALKNTVRTTVEDEDLPEESGVNGE